MDPTINECLTECPTDKLIYDSTKECYTRCNECESCKPGFFLNSTQQCQNSCQTGEIWVYPNNCKACDSKCYSCFNITGECSVSIYDYIVLDKKRERQQHQFAFQSFLVDAENFVLGQSAYESSLQEVALYTVNTGRVQAVTRTVRVENYFMTFGNFSEKLPSSYYDLTIKHKPEAIGSNPKLGLSRSSKKLRIFLDSDEDGVKRFLASLSEMIGTSNNGVTILTFMGSLTTLVLPFDFIGFFFRFA